MGLTGTGGVAMIDPTSAAMSLSPPLNYVEYAFIFLFVGFLEYFIHLRRLLFGNHRKLYAYISYMSLVLMTIGIFGALDYSGNILLIRNINDSNTGHLLSWVAIMLLVYRFGYNDILKGITVGAAFAACHEIVSVLVSLIVGAYGASMGVTLSQAISFYSTFFFMLGSIMVAFFAFGGMKQIRDLSKSMGVLVIFSIIVGSIGGVGTIDLLGPTQYFYNLNVNLIEQCSWLMPSIIFLVLSLLKREERGGNINNLPQIFTGGLDA
jgi:hypothetical protein